MKTVNSLSSGDKVSVIAGQHTGRTGIYIKSCSKAFDNWCRISLDLKGRERIVKVIMILKSEIQHEEAV